MTRTLVGILPMVGLFMAGCFLFKSKDADSPASSSTSASEAPGGIGPGGTNADTTPNGGSPHHTGAPGPGGTDPLLPPPPVPQPTAPPPVPSATTSAATPAASSSAGPVVPATIEVRNDCPDGLQLFVGETPGSSTGKQVTISGRSTTTGPTEKDGGATVWILDGKGGGVTKAHATAASKRIVIGIDCRSLRVE